MNLPLLIKALSNPAAYPDPGARVEVRHTHISVVFLVGRLVYKVKKPVSFGFLDFGTLAKRRHYCQEEVRLNRRLAPEVYLGVVPVTLSDGQIRVEGTGEVIEWAVKMRRLPDEATLQHRLDQNEVGVDMIETLARKIADFHARAQAGPQIAAFGRFEVVATNARDNFTESTTHIGSTVHETVFRRIRGLTEDSLACHRQLIEKRAERGVPRDTHGDLRLGHIYVFPERKPPADLVIIDCIEFNERYRFADPVSDMAFLAMGLAQQGRRDLARAFTEAYFVASGDIEGRALVPFYTAYRAAVRGKVEGLKLARPEISEADREATLTRARASWMLALSELEEPARRPCLILVGGLPGTGKSTVARLLAEHAGFSVLRSDVVRKEIGADRDYQNEPEFSEGAYSAEWNERTYEECLRRAERLLFVGKRVLVDASFREEVQRQRFHDAAIRWGVPGLFLLCEAAPEVVHVRLARRHEDASDADWAVYQKVSEVWEQPGSVTRTMQRTINTGATVEQSLAQAQSVLRLEGLGN